MAPAPALMPFPSADELVIEDTSRSDDSISITIRFQPLRVGITRLNPTVYMLKAPVMSPFWSMVCAICGGGDVVAKLFVTSEGPQKKSFLKRMGCINGQWWSDGMEL